MPKYTVLDQAAEAKAKAEWEAFQPKKDTIEWYDKWFADNTVDLGPRNSEYRARLECLKEWRTEREEFGDDDGWLAVLREQYQDCMIDEAQWAAESAAMESLAEGGLDLSGTGHIIGILFTGLSYDNVVLYSFC